MAATSGCTTCTAAAAIITRLTQVRHLPGEDGADGLNTLRVRDWPVVTAMILQLNSGFVASFSLSLIYVLALLLRFAQPRVLPPMPAGLHQSKQKMVSDGGNEVPLNAINRVGRNKGAVVGSH